MNVASILAAKKPALITIRPTDTIGALSRVLGEHKIGAAVVSTDGKAIDGVISERDIAYGLATHGGGLHAMPVSALMTRTVITCTSADDIAHVASTMLSRRVRHLPVTDGGQLVGMVSMRDVLSQRVDELQQQTALLRSTVSQVKYEAQDR